MILGVRKTNKCLLLDDSTKDESLLLYDSTKDESLIEYELNSQFIFDSTLKDIC